MGLEPLFEISACRGVQNSTDPRRMGKGFLAVGENIDIDDERMIHRAKGYEKILSGAYHSLWANGKISLFVQNGDLKRLWPDYSSTVILAGIDPSAEMEYLDVNDVIYFSNGIIIGHIINGVAYPFPEPNQTFKKRMVGGQLLEWFNSRLYAAQRDKLFYSDAGAPRQMDARKNFIQTGGYITMAKAVKDGFYLSSGKNVVFLEGRSPFEFVWNKVSDSPAFKGSAIKVEGEDIGKGFTGTAVIWSSREGVFIGLPGGQIKNLTDGNYVLDEDEVDEGASIYRDDLGFGQYVFLYTLKHGKGGAKAELLLPAPTVHSLG